ncbi:MAG TPA: alpha/beta fold hydrolase, partial [Polyangia bacterium]
MIEVRHYGTAGPTVIVLHGGPGAPGYMAPVARALADQFVVLEPLQRPSGAEPLTVARHLEDLDEVVRSLGAGARPALVGSSWGGMLALAYAAAHPDAVGAVVVIGSGTFDLAARARLRELLAARKSLPFDAQYTFAPLDALDPDDRPGRGFDRRANEETWSDMVRLQAEGVYPAAFA